MPERCFLCDLQCVYLLVMKHGLDVMFMCRLLLMRREMCGHQCRLLEP